MDLEYLIVGTAKNNPGDFEEFYRRTCSGAFAFALSYVKDRFIAREIAVEAYRRVRELAYKFDTDMNAEYWLLDIVKNLCINCLCDGEISGKAAERHTENLTHLFRQAICDTSEDRGKIIVLRLATGLSGNEIARLLWYRRISSNREFSRGLRQLVSFQEGGQSAAEIKKQLSEDIKECVPEYLSLILSDKGTAVSDVSHENLMVEEDELALPGETKEARKIRLAAQNAVKRRRRMIAVSVTAGCIVLAATAVLVWWFVSHGNTLIEDPEANKFTVTDPQYNTRVSLLEKNGMLYFGNLAQGGALYGIDMRNEGAEAVRLADGNAKDIISDDNAVYYRNSENGRICKLPFGGESITFEKRGSLLRFYDGRLYFSSASGISSMTCTGDDINEIFNDENSSSMIREDIEIAEDGTIYFSCGATEGVYRLTRTDAGYICDKIAEANVYDLTLKGSFLFFDTVSGGGTGTICRLNIGETGGPEGVSMNAILLSAAFYVKDNYIYYYGCRSVGEDGSPTDKGVYRIAADGVSEDGKYGGVPQLVLSLSDSKYDVSDLYVSDGFLYCYFCSGERKDAYMKLEAYKLSADGFLDGSAGAPRIIFKAGK